MRLTVAPGPARSVAALPVELVERKGSGHPDTLCDTIAERASAAYARHCLAAFGGVAHHWFDKVILLGGESALDFGRGELLRPYVVIFTGKAAFAVGDHAIPVEDVLRAAACDVLAGTLRGFDPDRHLRVEMRVSDGRGPGQARSRYRPSGPADLLSVDGGPRLANDCCICTGFAPLTPLERLVLDTERHVTGPEFTAVNLDTGSDVKVIGIRDADSYALRVNIPFIADLVGSRRTYLDRVTAVEEELRGLAAAVAGWPVDVTVNPERDRRSYLTVTGSVADTGDIGVVGRGNRANGLITPMRPMSIEAAAGKNPLDHSGKLYAAVCDRVADTVAATTGAGAEVFVTTTKERPLADPERVLVTVDAPPAAVASHEPVVRAIVADALAATASLTADFLNGATLW